MNSFGLEMFGGGISDFYNQVPSEVHPLQQMDTTPEIANVTEPQSKVYNPFVNMVFPSLSNRLHPYTLDSGLLFSVPIPAQNGGWAPPLSFIHLFVVFLFLFGLGDFLNLKAFVADYASNYFVVWMLLVAFCFLFVGLVTSIAIGTITLALVAIDNKQHPLVKILMLLAAVIHLSIASLRSPDLFSDYDVGFIIVYVILLCFVKTPNRGGANEYMRMRPYVKNDKNIDAGAGEYRSYADPDVDTFNTVWSGMSNKYTMK